MRDLTTSSGAQPKKQRSLPMLKEKLAMLDLLRDSMSVSNMAHKYGHNESSIRAIKIQVRNKTLVNTEKAFNLWLEDMNHKCVPIDGNTL
uniref:HTH psq-type domain-containing protein n=1 Tax=Crocodylus porosus TaxID=8502 RepID=A0A7M4FP58_CROPO